MAASAANLACQSSGVAYVSNSATSTETDGVACNWVSTTRTRSTNGSSSERTLATGTSLTTDTAGVGLEELTEMTQARVVSRIDEQWEWADHGHRRALPDLFYNAELYGVWGGMTESERHRLAGRGRTG